MAHIAKFKASQTAVLDHNSRLDIDRPKSHTNEDIDPDRTHLNYELHSTEGTARSRLNARLSELHVMQRDDVTVLDSLVVTLPADCKPEDERKFFEDVYAFACEEYGKENIINATVHKDEKTPHMHLGFIPVVEGKRRNGEPCQKVRHSALITKTYLETLHTRLSAHVEQALGYEVSILNGATDNGNKTINRLKAERYKAESERLQVENKELQEQNARLSEQIAQKDEQITALKEQAQSLTLDSKKGLMETKANFKERQALHAREQLIGERERALDERESRLVARGKVLDAREQGLANRSKNLDREVETRAEKKSAEIVAMERYKTKRIETDLNEYKAEFGEEMALRKKARKKGKDFDLDLDYGQGYGGRH